MSDQHNNERRPITERADLRDLNRNRLMNAWFREMMRSDAKRLVQLYSDDSELRGDFHNSVIRGQEDIYKYYEDLFAKTDNQRVYVAVEYVVENHKGTGFYGVYTLVYRDKNHDLKSIPIEFETIFDDEKHKIKTHISRIQKESMHHI